MDPITDLCSIRCVVGRGGVTIQIDGELDLATAPLLAAALDGVDGESGAVLLDISGLKFCDGAGLRVLELTRQRLGERFQVRGASPFVLRLAEIVGMTWIAHEDTVSRPRYGDQPS